MPSSTTRGAVPARVVLAQAQQRQRHADVVVELPSVAKRAVAEPGAQDRRDHLRHRGLAVAAGDGDQRQVKLRAPGGGQLLAAPRVSATCRPGRPASAEAALGQRRHGARGACACARKSCASKRSPRSATNRSPARSVRVSLCTRANRASRRRRPASSRAAARAPGPASSCTAHARPCAAAPRAPRRRRRTGGCTPAISW